MEKQRIFEILNDWNFWDKPLPKYIPRYSYQKKLSSYQRSGEIIILKGVRRAGKSSLLISHIHNLINEGVDKKEILFVNFEDPRFTGELNVALLEKIIDTYKEYVNDNSVPYIFLDEIQNVFQWEKWVLTGYELKMFHFYITGSSSKLLSKEFGTALGGRYLDINVLPLQFKEFIRFKGFSLPTKPEMVTNKLRYKKLFNVFIKDGGFPKVALLEDDLRRPEILMYFDTIILKDIVARYNLKNYDYINKVALFLLSNIGKPLSLNKIAVSLNISYNLINNYFEYLKNTYLFYEIYQYEYSLKKQFSGRRKVYCIDNGFLSNISFRISEDYGRFLENIVFLELKNRGDDIYFHYGKKECDFIVKKGLSIVQAIQVCRTLTDKDTETRELEGLIEALKTYGLREGLILTEDEEHVYNIDNYTLTVKPVWKWLLE